MDFQTIQLADVVVTFTGLLMLRFDPGGGYVEAGIHPSPFHRLRIAVELWKRNNITQQEDTLIERWERSGRLGDNVYIEVVNPAESGLTQFYYNNGPLHRPANPPNPTSELRPEQKCDIRWAIDLGYFHRSSELIVTSEEVFRHSIIVDNGLFHCAQLFKLPGPPALAERPLLLTRELDICEGVCPPPSQASLDFLGLECFRLNSLENQLYALTVAEVIGLANRLKPIGGKVNLQWGNQSPLFPFNCLEKPQRGYYYKIVFNNDCRQEGSCEPRNSRKSDLPDYYVQQLPDLSKTLEIMPNVPEDQRLNLEESVAGTVEYPCMPVIIP